MSDPTTFVAPWIQPDLKEQREDCILLYNGDKLIAAEGVLLDLATGWAAVRYESDYMFLDRMTWIPLRLILHKQLDMWQIEKCFLLSCPEEVENRYLAYWEGLDDRADVKLLINADIDDAVAACDKLFHCLSEKMGGNNNLLQDEPILREKTVAL